MPDALVLFTGAVVFMQMYGLGTRQRPGTFKRLFSNPSLLVRSIISVLLVVPVVALGLILVLPLPPHVATGLAILAAAPGAPLTSRRSEAAIADFEFVSALQVLLACLAILFTPLALQGFDLLPNVTIDEVSPLTIAVQVGSVTLLPASLGWVSALLAPRLRDRKTKIVAAAAKGLYVLFLLVMVLALWFLPDLRSALAIGWIGGIALAIFCTAALLSGSMLGGPQIERRSGLAIASIARNIGLALYISELSEATYGAIPTILLFAVLGVGLALPFSLAMRRLRP